MNRYNPLIRIFVVLLLLVFAFPAMAQQEERLADSELRKMYEEAVRDAAVAEPDEIFRDLIAITTDNPTLSWREAERGEQVLMVTWTSWDGYDDKIGKDMTLSREVWVTAVPQLKDFCKSHPEAIAKNRNLRLEQLLGLPPGNGKTKFIELWVEPKNLYRPSPDPEISDHEAQLDFPISEYFQINEQYVQWFDDLKFRSYGVDGYPWTRLGYTYDWARQPTEVGLSEFVIRAQSDVGVHSVTATEDYCK